MKQGRLHWTHFPFTTVLLATALMFSVLNRRVQAQGAGPQTGIDARSGLHYIEFQKPEWKYAAVSMRPDGEAIAIGTESGTIELYDSTFHPLGILRGHTAQVWSVAWKPDGSQLASASDDKTVRIWDIATMTSIKALPHQHGVVDATWSPDGTRLATIETEIIAETNVHLVTSDTAHIWDMAAGGTLVKTIDGLQNAATNLTWSPDGTKLAGAGGTADLRGSWVLIWDARNGNLITTYPGVYDILDLAWSPDGSKLAYGTLMPETEMYSAVIINSADSGQFLYRSDHIDTVSGLQWSPDSRKLAQSNVGDSTIKVLDLPTANKIYLSGKDSAIQSLSWSKSGRYLASADMDGNVRIWDMSGLPDLSGTPTITPWPTDTPTPTVTPNA
jgi:WD40 repeat protein